MLLTVADVLLRMFAGAPIRGTFELVELGLAATFFLALPMAFWRDENIVVDTADQRAPRLVPHLRRVAGAVSAAVLGLMTWQALAGARDSLAFGDVSADLGLPQVLYWMPVILGLAGALAAVLLRGDGDT
ncbi:MAG: TRAP transporter small permease [Burkholderiales bacterium]|jgi:TRAP-type C4-dicarboxylate transport system permease small subunit|nr:TRAP transporter small permease [Burkholderiales bacterium]